MIESESCEDSDKENSVKSGKKKLIKKKATWRSPEFQSYIESLDRKMDRHQSERGWLMALKVEIGECSSHGAPDGCPEWACSIFD